MPPPVRSAEREGRPNHCGRRRRACIPIPPADGSAGEVRIFYCIQGGTTHNVRDNDVCVRCENKREEPPNCCGRKCYERGCCGQRRCRQRRHGRKHHARMPIPPAEDSAGEVRIFYCIRVETAHNVRSDGSCARKEKKKGRGVSPSLQVLEYLSKEAVLRPSRVPPIKKWDITGTDNYYTF